MADVRESVPKALRVRDRVGKDFSGTPVDPTPPTDAKELVQYDNGDSS